MKKLTKSKSNPNQIFRLSKKQMLSDVIGKFDLNQKNTLVISPTGSGKTYALMQQYRDKKVVIAVPQTSLIDNLMVSYPDAVCFQSGHRDVSEDNRMILTTYDSLSLLTTIIDPSERLLVIDEVHVLIDNASKEFKRNVSNQVISVIPKFDKVIQLTATPISHKIPNLVCDHSITISKDQTCIKKVHIVRTTDKLVHEAIKIVRINVAGKIQTMILVDKKDHQLLFAMLDAYNIRYAIINADNKNTVEYKNIVGEGNLKDVDVVISTTVMREGTSITVHNEHMSIVTIGMFPVIGTVQFAGRPRKAINIDMYVLKPHENVEEDATVDNKSLVSNMYKLYDLHGERAEQDVIVAQNMYNVYKKTANRDKHNVELRSASIKMYNTINPYMKFNETTDKYEVDYLGLSYDCFTQYTRICYLCDDIMYEEFAKFGWVKGDQYQSQPLEQEFIEQVKEKVAEIKAEVKAVKQKQLELLSNSTVGDNFDLLRHSESGYIQLAKPDVNIRKKLNIIADVLNLSSEDKLESAVKALNILGTGSDKWGRTIQMIDYAKQSMKSSKMMSHFKQLVTEKDGNLRKFVSSEEARQIVRSVHRQMNIDCGAPICHFNDYQATELFGLMCHCKNKEKVSNKTRVRGYEIIDLNPLNPIVHLMKQ